MKKLKKDLVNNLSSKLSLEKDEITQIVDTVLDGVKEILSEGSSLEIRGFGTFEVKIRKGKKNARNPKTGEKVQTHIFILQDEARTKEIPQRPLEINGQQMPYHRHYG